MREVSIERIDNDAADWRDADAADKEYGRPVRILVQHKIAVRPLGMQGEGQRHVSDAFFERGDAQARCKKKFLFMRCGSDRKCACVAFCVMMHRLGDGDIHVLAGDVHESIGLAARIEHGVMRNGCALYE